jgi:hypothetical protein
LEQGLPAFIVGDKKTNGKKIEKYNSTNAKQSGVYNQDAEIQLTKKKKHREEDDESDVVPVKKKKRTESD